MLARRPQPLHKDPSPPLGLAHSRELSATTATAMRSLLLALALVCGIQATVVPRTMEDLDIRQVQGCVGACWGAGAKGGCGRAGGPDCRDLRGGIELRHIFVPLNAGSSHPHVSPWLLGWSPWTPRMEA